MEIKQSRAIESFTEKVMKVAADRLKRPLTVAETKSIVENIAAKSHILSRTPDHPPYAAMIHEAIRELNKESGSSEESISNFIKNKYPDLPFHHTALLKLYLRKLCDKKELLLNPNNHYALAYEPIISAPIEVHDQPEERPIESREEEEGEKEVGDEGQFMSTNEEKTSRRGRGRGRGRGKKSMVILEEEKRTEEEIHVNINEHEPSRRGRGRDRGRGRGNKEKSKKLSTSDLILGLVRDKKNS